MTRKCIEFKIPKMATINEAAALTGLAKHFIRQLALQNKVRSVRAGKKILVNLEKLVDFLNGQTEIWGGAKW